MAKQIFRKAALDRLASPEQLDSMIKITSAKGWLALAAIGMLLIVGILWGVYGSIPTKVNGKGILLKKGGVLNIEAHISGKIKGIYVNEKDIINDGQVIARISQPEIHDKIAKNKNQIENLNRKFAKESKDMKEEIKLKLESIKDEKTKLLSLIKQENKKIEWLKTDLQNNKELLKDGLVTENKIIKIKQQIFETQNNIKNYKNQLNNLKYKKTKMKNEYGENAVDYQSQISAIKEEIEQLETKLEQNSQIISPYKGRILEINTEKNDIVSRGDAILSLELIGKDIINLESVIYLSPLSGEKVKPGMKIQISPSNVEEEKYGFMIGIVTDVSNFPATPKGMMNTLQNENLVKTLSAEGPPVKMAATLIPSAKTYSGYKWSTGDGPPVKIYSGTICFASVTVKKQPPITLVMPMLKKYLLGSGADL